MNGDGKAVCFLIHKPLCSFSFFSSLQWFHFIPNKVTFAWLAFARVSV